MGTKREELAKLAAGTGCLAKAHDDEPIFILRAQDNLAADLVELWAIRAAVSKKASSDKLGDAQMTADAMRLWPIHKDPD